MNFIFYTLLNITQWVINRIVNSAKKSGDESKEAEANFTLSIVNNI